MLWHIAISRVIKLHTKFHDNTLPLLMLQHPQYFSHYITLQHKGSFKFDTETDHD